MWRVCAGWMRPCGRQGRNDLLDGHIRKRLGSHHRRIVLRIDRRIASGLRQHGPGLQAELDGQGQIPVRLRFFRQSHQPKPQHQCSPPSGLRPPSPAAQGKETPRQRSVERCDFDLASPCEAGKHRQDCRCLQRMLPAGRATWMWRAQAPRSGEGGALEEEKIYNKRSNSGINGNLRTRTVVAANTALASAGAALAATMSWKSAGSAPVSML